MPKNRVSGKKMFRDFSVMHERWYKDNYLKRLGPVMDDMTTIYDIGEAQFKFMLYVYDLEFWTLDWISQDYNRSKKKLGERIVYPLMKMGYIYKHFDKLSPSDTREDHLFREETKYNYGVRYALSQQGRLVVSRFYRKMRGEERLNVIS